MHHINHSKVLSKIFLIFMVFFITFASSYSQPSEDALLQGFRWRNIGPANMGGRISDIQALESDFRVVVVASASGGVWKSINAGTTWEPIFDRYGSGSIGAVGLFQKNPDVIWVGTGEANVRNSVGWGDGVYKSVDGGKTFQHVGLKDTHHIAKIAAHPSDPDIVYVAAQGHLWGHTGQRGLFKTEDGGKSWEKLGGGLPEDGKTGCTHIVMDPVNPEILYAAFWERLRWPYRFDSGGANGGIFKSLDAGKTWEKLTEGLPEGEVGRIGLAVFKQNPRVIMAIIEHGFQPRRGTKDYDNMSKLGTGVYRSEDGGETWQYINRYNNRPFYYSQIYLNPVDNNRVYVMGTQAQVSEDGGKTLAAGMPGIAGDYHVMWLDPNNKDRYYIGNDKGISLTHDHGKHFNFFDNFVISQIYNVSADLRDPYFVYVGLQDNGVWGGPSNSRDFEGIRNDHWFKFHSGDGFYTAVDPLDWTTVYSESQGGRLRRNHGLFRQVSDDIEPRQRNTRNWDEMVPKEENPDYPVVRKNWNTPFIISPHNHHTLYYGANHVFKSVNRGETWEIISPDLSTRDSVKINRESGGLTRDVTQAEAHCTVVTLSESPLKPGLLWAGTDDGNIQITQNDGTTWENVRPNVEEVPEGIWVSRLEASHHDEATCYVTFDSHRSDVFKPFVFKTSDYGKSWMNITGNLPDGHCTHVIREDPINQALLFVGTEFAVYVSFNSGQDWVRLMNNLPTVAIHDLLIHSSGDLIAGTHGRGVWILDDISPLQQLSPGVMASEVHLFQNPAATLWKGISRGGTRGHQLFIGRNPLVMTQEEPANSPPRLQAAAGINYYLKSNSKQKPELEIAELTGSKIFRTKLDSTAGINRYHWNFRFPPSVSQQKAFRERMEEAFKTLKERIETDLVKDVDKLYQEFKQATTPDELNRIRRKLIDEFGGIIRSRRLFTQELQGPQAHPGIYRLKLTVDGDSHEGILSVREDPLFEQQLKLRVRD